MLAIPTVHMNGTSKAQLVDDLMDARYKIDIAMAALCKASPNSRDYYTQGPQAFSKAQEEHAARVVRLNDVAEELYAIAQAIDEQG